MECLLGALAKAQNISRIARYLGLHRSRFYRWKKRSLVDRDDKDHSLIRELFLERKEKIGERQLKMLLYRRFRRVMNRKKIARIKRKYGLITKIRRKKTYRVFAKIAQEHRSFPNLLNREFHQRRPDRVYTTDVTELPYGDNQKAYLAVFKDLATREIVSSELSKRAEVKFVITALKNALRRLPVVKRKSLLVHSDQGFHFTHFGFRKFLEENKVVQSMSRKGNCLDNAPTESFFGHLKDHLTRHETYEEMSREVTKEIKYYNQERPQWDLKRMPPKKFRRHLNRNRAFINLSPK
jgi:putative transposase